MEVGRNGWVAQCQACGQGNRLPLGRLLERAHCGRCKSLLGPPAEPLDANRETFDALVEGARAPVLVDFWAPWCGPCRVVAPEVARVAREVAGRALVLKVDTEAEPALAARFGIQAIPTFVVLSGGKKVAEQQGAVRAPSLLALLARAGMGRAA